MGEGEMRSAPSVCSPVSLRSRLVYPSALLLIAPPPLRGRMDIDVLEGVTAEARPPAAVCLCARVFLSLPLSPARFPSLSPHRLRRRLAPPRVLALRKSISTRGWSDDCSSRHGAAAAGRNFYLSKSETSYHLVPAQVPAYGDHWKGICPTQPGRAFLRVMISEARVHLAGTRSTDWRAPRAGGAATQQKRGTRRTIEPERTSAAAAPASSRLRA